MGEGDLRTVSHKEMTRISAKYFARCATKLFRNMNAIYNTLYFILIS